MILYSARTKGTHCNRANTLNHVNNKVDFYLYMEESGFEVNEEWKEEDRKKGQNVARELGKDLDYTVYKRKGKMDIGQV